jgi:hypothetical protein
MNYLIRFEVKNIQSEGNQSQRKILKRLKKILRGAREEVEKAGSTKNSVEDFETKFTFLFFLKEIKT